MRPVACAAVALACTVAGCGGSDEGERAQLQAALDGVGQAFDDRDPKAVCDGLGAVARRQVILVGHGSSRSCAFAVRTWFLKPLYKGRRAMRPDDKPTIEAVEHRQSGITVGITSVEGRLVRVPFVKEGGEWKVNTFYGLTPKASVIID
jgi:hypothetical protein